MQRQGLGRSLALGVWVLAAFTTLANASMPVASRRPGLGITLLVAILLAGHGVLYWLGDRVRARFTLAGYVAAQAGIVFLVGLTSTPVPAVLGLYIALTVETVIVAEQRWGTMPITAGAIVLYGVGAIVTSDLYRGATAGLFLAVSGVLAHAIVALVQRREREPRVERSAIVEGAAAARTEVESSHVDFDRRELARLTTREREVLQALTNGTRTSDIAEQLGISERTVKAHLANIYQKLGVESRAGAVAVALHKGA